MLYRLSYVRARLRLAKRPAESLQRGMARRSPSADDESMRGLKDWRREDGQTMAEYGVILAVITPAIVAAIALLAFAIAGNLGAVADLFS
jgi:Flp pilus assembly pilin Flp